MAAKRKTIIAVFGGSQDSATTVLSDARALGAAIASGLHIVLTGGRGPGDAGVKGAALVGAVAVSPAPADGRPPPWIGVLKTNRAVVAGVGGFVLPTDFGDSRNYLEALLCDAAICLPGEDGTVSEATFTLYLGKPVAFLGDAWRKQSALPADPQACGQEWAAMVERAYRRVRSSPCNVAFNLPDQEIVEGSAPPQSLWTLFPTGAEADRVLAWTTAALGSPPVPARGAFPSIQGYEDQRREYESWLQRA